MYAYSNNEYVKKRVKFFEKASGHDVGNDKLCLCETNLLTEYWVKKKKKKKIERTSLKIMSYLRTII